MTWAHFVPAYDKWLDGTYVKQWGEANDVEVKIDHINNALLYSTGAAEVAAQSGHDLFWFISPAVLVPEAGDPGHRPRPGGEQEGRADVARREEGDVQPEDEAVLRLPGDYAPDPVQYRRSLLQQTGVSLNTWDDLRQGAAKLKAIGHPGRPRHVERDRLEHAADLAPLLLRRLHPERGEPHRHRPRLEPEGRDPGAAGHGATSTRTACPTRSSPGPPPRTTRRSSPVGSRSRSTRSRSPARRRTRGTRRCRTTRGSPRSRAARRCASGTST